MHSVTLRRSAALLLVAAVLTACGSSSSGTGGTVSAAPAATTSAPAPSSAPAGLTLADAWIKTGKAGAMTAVFGTLTNSGTSDVVVASGSTDVATKVELHEVVMADGAMKMQPKAGGFTVPAGGTHVLEPGHDHIMVMGLAKDVMAGDTVTVTLTLGDGSTVTVQAVGKDFTGANETYAPSASMTSGM